MKELMFFLSLSISISIYRRQRSRDVRLRNTVMHERNRHHPWIHLRTFGQLEGVLPTQDHQRLHGESRTREQQELPCVGQLTFCSLHSLLYSCIFTYDSGWAALSHH